MTGRGKGFRVCDSCGATLDPEETCECKRRKPEKKRYEKMRAIIYPIEALELLKAGKTYDEIKKENPHWFAD